VALKENASKQYDRGTRQSVQNNQIQDKLNKKKEKQKEKGKGRGRKRKRNKQTNTTKPHPPCKPNILTASAMQAQQTN
jgi:hypothetical protein